MLLLCRSFGLVDMDIYNASLPKMIKLPRKIVDELVMLAVLCPLIVADVAVEAHSKIFATDASLSKGAIVEADVPVQFSRMVWKCCRSKGGYSKLLDPVQQVLSRCVDFEEKEELSSSSPPRPLAYRFDFIEVFAGAAVVTACVANLGYSVGCPIEFSYDQELDMRSVFVMEWISYLVVNRFVKAFCVEPPCTTYSIMRRPALRDKLRPFGFDPSESHTRTGNTLAHRALQLLHLALLFGVVAILENPWSSKIKNLPAWIALASQRGVQTIRTDSCAYGVWISSPQGFCLSVRWCCCFSSCWQM